MEIGDVFVIDNLFKGKNRRTKEGNYYYTCKNPDKRFIIKRFSGTGLTIYYDDNAEKQTINEQIGTINYNTGSITINDIRVISVIPSDGLIRLTIESEKGIVKPTKNTIITVEENDTSSISTELVSI